MPVIKSHRFERGGYEYEANLDFKDEAIINNSLEIGVIGKMRSLAANSTWTPVELLIKVDFTERCIVLLHEENVIGRIALDTDISDEWIDPEEDWDRINKEFIADQDLAAKSLEEAIQLIPTPDPVIGCILKAGVSTSVGQIIRCERETREVEYLAAKVRSILGCMLTNSLAMLSVATVRAIRCSISLGLG